MSEQNDGLAQRIREDQKQALKNGERELLEALRFLVSKIQNKEIDTKSDLSDEDVVSIIRTEIKQSRESLEFAEKAGRDELVEENRARIAIFEDYLPAQMDDDDVREIVSRVIDEEMIMGPQDFGRVMGKVMDKVGGRAEGSEVKRIVESELEKIVNPANQTSGGVS